MKARFVMNQPNGRNPNGSEISQDMLQLNGELNSGMSKESGGSSYYHPGNSGYAGNRTNQTNQYNQGRSMSPANGQQTYSRQSLNRYSGHALDGLEPINDEMRKRPFTIPVVRVEINCENPMESSNIKPRQSHVTSYE